MTAVGPDPDIFTKRGIPEWIWKARPYERWTIEDTDPAKRHFADLGRHQRAFISKLVNQAPGYVITRHTPHMRPELPRIYPELRPDVPVKTQGPTQHWHGDGTAPEGLTWWQTMPGDRNHWQPHIVKDGTEKPVDQAATERNFARNAHCGHNTDELHSHQAFAKYVFPPGALVDETYEHDHSTARWGTMSISKRADKRAAHIARTGKAGHQGQDIDGLHSHTIRKKSNDDNLAARIDVHPLALPALLKAPVVFFVIEGCLKADAVLANGGAVFSVPSVSLWDCRELWRFAAEYLFDKTVVIVPDGDWNTKSQVINQAMLCQNQLSRANVPRVLVAAPPSELKGHDTKGVDDFIGHSGQLEDLRVIDSEPATGLWEFIASKNLRRDRAMRDYEVLRALSTFTRSPGALTAPLQSVARVLGIRDRATVPRAVKSLKELGAITVDGDLGMKWNWFSRNYEWEQHPTITLIPELRSTESPEKCLSDSIHLPLRAPRREVA